MRQPGLAQPPDRTAPQREAAEAVDDDGDVTPCRALADSSATNWLAIFPGWKMYSSMLIECVAWLIVSSIAG